MYDLTFESPAAEAEARLNLLNAVIDVQTANLAFLNGTLTYESGVYNFDSLSNAEFLAQKTGLKKKPTDAIQNIEDQTKFDAFAAENLDCSNLPGSLNWTALGKLAPVQDQTCGNCYIYSTVAAIESSIAISYNKSVEKLSENYVTNCMGNPGNLDLSPCESSESLEDPNNCTSGTDSENEGTCDGGYELWVYDFAKG